MESFTQRRELLVSYRLSPSAAAAFLISHDILVQVLWEGYYYPSPMTRYVVYTLHTLQEIVISGVSFPYLPRLIPFFEAIAAAS